MKKTTILVLLLVMFVFIAAKKYSVPMKKIEVGDQVPAFTLNDQNGKSFSVHAQMKKPMVIYFYPKDDTPGCVKEACRFRDDFEKFTDLGVLVIGISGDSVASHKKFEEKYNLPFTLLADVDNAVRKLFDVPKSMLLFPGRVTYIVDKNGIVQYIFNSQFAAEKHIENALKKLQEMATK